MLPKRHPLSYYTVAHLKWNNFIKFVFFGPKLKPTEMEIVEIIPAVFLVNLTSPLK